MWRQNYFIIGYILEIGGLVHFPGISTLPGTPLLAEFFFFTSIQLANMSGDLQVKFLVENYFNLGNPFFVLYTDIPKFHLISTTALMMNDLH